MTTFTAFSVAWPQYWIDFTMHTKNDATTVETTSTWSPRSQTPHFEFGYRKSIYEHMGYVLFLITSGGMILYRLFLEKLHSFG